MTEKEEKQGIRQEEDEIPRMGGWMDAAAIEFGPQLEGKKGTREGLQRERNFKTC